MSKSASLKLGSDPKQIIDLKEAYQIPRFSLIWLITSLVAVIVPHFLRMPFWLVALCGFCILGRVLIFQGKISHLSSFIKTIIVLTTFVSLVFQFGSEIFSIDANVAILIASISLKLLEMRKKRDVLMVIYLCYFAVIGEFIYSQTILVALYMSLCVCLITSTLMSLNQNQEHQDPRRTLRLSATILIQSVPLMLALFILFPRMAPLWSVPLQSASGVTGLSDNMSPGDIGDLIRSDELAFRVSFEGSPPPSYEMYWRGITLDNFNGRTWRRGFNLEPQFLGSNPLPTFGRYPNAANVDRPWFEEIEYLGDEVAYNIILEPNFQNWIFTLKIPQIQDDRLLMRRDFQVASIRRIGQRFTYDARSYLDHRVDTDISRRELRRALFLPEQGNERSREFASNLRAQAGSDEAYIQALLSYFREQEFYYTLEPALLGEDSIDDFLFNTMEGFCEHYSSTFTFLLRAAGVPARVVTGYQGGELNPYDGTLTVRQYDAHAWTEVWLEGEGWKRVDPTAAVAPDRINYGSQQTFQEQESFLEDAGFSMLRFRNSAFLNSLRLRLEMLDYSWNRFVLNYNQESQFAFFGQFFENVTKQKIIITMLSFIFLSVSIMVFFVLRKPVQKALHPATKLYLRYCDFLAKRGFERVSGETPQHYFQRISRAQPHWEDAMEGITENYVDIIYKTANDESMNSEKIKHLKHLIRKFRITG